MRVRGAAVLITLCAALAGCSDDGKATVLPTLTATPSASPMPTAVATPTGKDAATPAGAAAFARFWYSEITRAYTERDSSIVERLSAPGCKACVRYIDSIAAARNENQRVTGVVFTLTLVEAMAVVGDKVTVAVIYNAPANHRYNADGKEIGTSEPAVLGFEEELKLVRRGTSWMVAEDTAV